jgi:hypothetical protein
MGFSTTAMPIYSDRLVDEVEQWIRKTARPVMKAGRRVALVSGCLLPPVRQHCPAFHLEKHTLSSLIAGESLNLG